MATAPAKTADGWGDSEDGWSSSSSTSSASAGASKSGGWLGDSKADDGWGTPDPASRSSSWLGDSAPEAEPVAGRGWLGDPQGPEKKPSSDNGWISDGPSMTDMIDEAIAVEESDEFVDDSWVDETIRYEDENDGFDVPEYEPPSPEVGGAFLKMLLVAVLVVILGGGAMFMGTKEDPELVAAAEREKQVRAFQSYLEDGNKEMAKGNAGFAASQYEAALVEQSKLGATREEIDQTELKLSQALMAGQEYEDAIEHWDNLVSSPVPEVAEAAKEGVSGAEKGMRAEANLLLAAAEEKLDQETFLGAVADAEDALVIYEDYGGDKSQLSKAHGIIGLSFLRRGELGTAEKHLKFAAVHLPEYQKHLNSIKMEIKPRPRQPVRPKNQERRVAVFDTGSEDYERGRRVRPRRRRGNRNNNNPAPVSTQPQQQRMKEIPIYRGNQRSNNNKPRLGSDRVVNGYDSR